MNDTTKNSNQVKSTKTIVAELKQDFCKKLDTLAYGSSHHKVFCSWAEIAAITMHQLPYQAGCLPKDELFEEMEAHYLRLAKHHDGETLKEFGALMAITLMALSHNWTDFLGAIYMELSGKKSKQANGEFFTPYCLAQLTAQMTLLDFEEVIKRKGYLTISEPACGAGAMLIAAGEVVANKGYLPGKVLFFEAVDINPLFCHMAYIQFVALGLPGIVYHGDTIKYEFWNRWETPECKIRRFLTGSSPLDNRTSDSQPTTSRPGQLNLFGKPAASDTDKVA
ncbi:MAG: SAM-dependent DNA methyltransferase [Symploca sp. SIO1B1]|nr:SAM-dependent DNA methyltransferase [Symploca sp. SIO1B1]